MQFSVSIQCPCSAVVIVIGKGDLLSTDDTWNVLIDNCKRNRTFGVASVNRCTGAGNRTQVLINMENPDAIELED